MATAWLIVSSVHLQSNKIDLIDLPIYGLKKNVSLIYFLNTLCYKDLFLTIIHFNNRDFVKGAIFKRKILVFKQTVCFTE